MKKLFTIVVFLASALCAAAQTVNDEFRFNQFTVNQSASFSWDNNNYLQSISQNGNTKYYSSWLNQKARFSAQNTSHWSIWGGSGNESYLQMNYDGSSTFYIHDLKVGDVVTLQTEGSCTIQTAITATGVYSQDDEANGHFAGDDIINEVGTPITQTWDGWSQELRIVGDGTLAIEFKRVNGVWPGIHAVNIQVNHEAQYEIEGQTFRFTGDGILTDKHAAVPRMNVSFGADNELTYVVKETYGNDSYYSSTTIDANWNKYTKFDDNGPNSGTYYKFFPQVDGKIKFKGFFISDGSNQNDQFNCLYFTDFENRYNGGTHEITKNGSSRFIETGEFEVLKGHTYYISNHGNYSYCHDYFLLTEYTFTPSSSVYSGPLSFVTSHGATSVPSATLDASGLTNVKIKACLGNIQSASATVSNGQLCISNITYYKNDTYKENEQLKNGKSANQGGAILVYLNPTYSDGGEVSGYDDVFVVTVPYAAEQYADRNTKQVKVWDFYTAPLQLGKSTDNESQLYKEMHKGNGQSDWTDTYVNLHKPGDDNHVFKNAYEMEGDNADMIVETEGLIFNTDPNVSCIFNELGPSTSSEFHDRFVGLFNGGKFTIPSLSPGDYIRIKMNRYGSSSDGKAQAILKVTGATDICGNTIGNDYSIGGSAPFDTGDKSQPNAEYNFISTGGNFTIQVVDAALLKLYRIEIYKNSDFVANNRVHGNGRSILYTDNDAARTESIFLHFRGKGESIKCLEQTGHTGTYYDNTTGKKDIVFAEEHDGSTYITTLSYTPVPNVDFGSVLVKIGCMTMNGKYVTDYAYWGVTVGYRETMAYPYTWDFTDLSSRVASTANGMTAEIARSEPNREWYDYSNTCTGFYHRVGYDGHSDEGGRFAQGGQLYAGSKMIQETRGLGMNMSNVSPLYNDGMQIVQGGLELNSKAGADWWRHRIEIPKVPANAVVYVRVKKLDDDDVVAGHFFAGYTYGSWVRNSNTEQDMPTALQIYDRESNGDDYTYIIPGDAKSAEKNITLYLNGVILKRIAVSEDFKKIGKTGFATESRTRIIDHDLTSYFTGVPVKAYRGEYNNATKPTKVILKPVRFMQEAPTGPTGNEGLGCILYNSVEANGNDDLDRTVSVYNGGFHLFVPDMHDNASELGDNYNTCDNTNNIIKACVPSFIAGDSNADFNYNLPQLESSDDDVRYILTAKPYSTAGQGSSGIEENSRLVGFYQVDPQKGAKMHGNASYLQMAKSIAPASSGAKMSIVFEDELFGEIGNGIATGISEVSPQMDNGQWTMDHAEWYNLNGQKINGMPTESGLYIVNGKKVMVK